jgi:hypothetical protein
MTTQAVQERILSHYGASSVERKARMKTALEARFGANLDETPEDQAEVIISAALSPDEFGTMLVTTMEEVTQWLADNYLDA